MTPEQFELLRKWIYNSQLLIDQECGVEKCVHNNSSNDCTRICVCGHECSEHVVINKQSRFCICSELLCNCNIFISKSGV